MLDLAISVLLVFAQHEDRAIQNQFHYLCESAFPQEPNLRAECLADPPDCLMLENKPGRWYVVGFSGAPHWVCSWDHVPGAFR